MVNIVDGSEVGLTVTSTCNGTHWSLDTKIFKCKGEEYYADCDKVFNYSTGTNYSQFWSTNFFGCEGQWSLKFVFLFRLWRPTFRRCWKYGLSIEPPLSAALVLQVHLSQGSDSGRKNHRDLQTTKGIPIKYNIKWTHFVLKELVGTLVPDNEWCQLFFAKAVVQSSILEGSTV